MSLETSEGILIPGSNLEVPVMLDRMSSFASGVGVVIVHNSDGSRTEKHARAVHEINPDGIVVRRNNTQLSPSSMRGPITTDRATLGPDYGRVISENIARTVASLRDRAGE